MLKKIWFSLVSALFISNASLAMAEEVDLSRISKSGRAVRVFLEGFSNESGQAQILPEDFKKSLEDALLKRKAVKFEVVKSSIDADLKVSGRIKKYQYLEKDPVTTYVSPSGFLIDAMTTENYVTMDVEFAVTDTKTNRNIWKDAVTAFIKRTMTPKESIPLIYDKVSRTFLWKCFGKPK